VKRLNKSNGWPGLLSAKSSRRFLVKGSALSARDRTRAAYSSFITPSKRVNGPVVSCRCTAQTR
jgi:hypothetical protein